MSKVFDIAVIGLGSMGSVTCYHLAKRGVKVLGLDKFNSPHEYGSHTGQSRLIRKSYFESLEYVPLLIRAYEIWDEIERQSGTNLFHRTGILYMGHAEHPILNGVIQSGKKFGLGVKSMDREELKKKSERFVLPENTVAIWEADAGMVLPEKTISVSCDLAAKFGASLNFNNPLISWKKKRAGYYLHTKQGQFVAKKMIFTAGAWTKQLLPNLDFPLTVHQQTLGWFAADHDAQFVLNKFPCWMYAPVEMPGVFYGFPMMKDQEGPMGLKIAYHHPSQEINPDHKSEDANPEDLEILRSFADQYLPNLGNLVTAKTCLYTNSKDEHFCIDFLPGHDQDIVFACGFSGHGFKFAPVIGEILADLILQGKSELLIGFLKLR